MLNRVGYEHDLLAAVLERTGLRGQVYCRTQARAPWGLSFKQQAGAVFHTVSAGTCWLTHGGERVQLAAGDLVLFARGAQHALSDAPRSPKLDLEAWLTRIRRGGRQALGSDRGAVTEILCGVYDFELSARAHPVLDLLPPLLHLRPSAERPDIAGTLGSLHGEYARGPLGSALVISRLLDVLFVQIVRAWVEGAPEQAGWIGALTEPVLARALAAMHRELERDWTVDELARVSGTSRATLARRFGEQVGEAPLAYLTRMRLEEAARRLVSGQEGLASIAQHVGYSSEFAFNRAFRRLYGEPPGRYRERLQTAGPLQSL
jgi:AraC-like DNA-binding protein